MNESIIAVRYTKALFNLALEKNVLEKVREDMDYVSEAYKISEELRFIIDNPVLKPSKKVQIVKDVFKDSNDLTKSFIEILIKNRRENLLPFITIDFKDKYLKFKNIETVSFVSAVRVDEKIIEKIKRSIEQSIKKEIIIDKVENPNIIGGFILKIGDKQYDSSIRKKLNILKQEIKNTQITKLKY